MLASEFTWRKLAFWISLRRFTLLFVELFAEPFIGHPQFLRDAARGE